MRLFVLAMIWAGCRGPRVPDVPGDTDTDTDTDVDTDADADADLTVPTFVGSWGGYGTEPGEFIEPSSVELTAEGIVIVAGHEDRIQRFTPEGELLDIFGVPGPGDGQFNHPHGLAVDRNAGLLYVGDQENGRLQVFTTSGDFIRQWGDAGFQHIHDVGIDQVSGELFVGDFELDTLRKFSSTGELLAEFGGTGAAAGLFQGVWGVSTDSEGAVYVADTFNRRVQKFDRQGSVLAEWTTYAGEEFLKPTGIYVDVHDVVYVCDSLARRVVLFDTAGSHLLTWDLTDIVGIATEPEDIVVNDLTGDIYIGEVFDHTVLHLRRAQGL